MQFDYFYGSQAEQFSFYRMDLRIILDPLKPGNVKILVL